MNSKEYYHQYYINNKEKKSEQMKQWRIDNPEYGKQQYKKHREREIERGRQYRINNPEKVKEYDRKCRSNNPEKTKEKYREYLKTEKGKAKNQRAQSKRRAIIKTIINTLTFDEWHNILKQYKFRCAYCGKEFDLFDIPERDHIVPISKGGNNTKENVVPACRSCNARKGNKIL